MYGTRRYILASLLLLLTLGFQPLMAQLGPPDSVPSETSTPISLGSLVDTDGAIRLDVEARGPIDPSGWRVEIGTDGTPRFYRTPDIGMGSEMPIVVEGDECWSTMFGPKGVYGTVYAMHAVGTELYIGGNFRIAGPILANNIVSFNTETGAWSIVGEGEGANGTNGPVYAITSSGNDVYAGGRFSQAGTTQVSALASYNRASRSWSALGGGVMSNLGNWPVVVPYEGTVRAMAVVDGNLYVGGTFDLAGDRRILNLAKWDVTLARWTYPCRVEAEAPNGPVYALAGRDSILYVGGEFSRLGPVTAANIAGIDVRGGSFVPVGTGFDGSVRALRVAGNGTLYAGGEFRHAGSVTVNYVAQYNGTAWSALGGGTDAPVYALATSGNAVYVGGTFAQAGGIPASNVAVYQGGGWRAMAEGLAHTSAPIAYAIETIDGHVYTGGLFTAAGTSSARGAAQYDSARTAWSALGDTAMPSLNGANGAVYAVAISGDDMFIGGDFTNVGGVAARAVARYNRRTELWYTLGDGITDPAAFVRALAIGPDGDLYVGGIFSEAGGIATRGIARWDGTTWSAVGGGITGNTPFVFALLFNGPSLYVAGAFEGAGSVLSEKVIRWNSTDSTWNALGNGITGDSNYSFVQSLALLNDTLYAGGFFTRIGATQANYIARWGGSAWLPIIDGSESGMNAPVTTMLSHQGLLYAGGEFTRAGETQADYIASWNGTAWSALDSGSGTSGPVRSLAILGDSLVAGGEFLRAGDSAVTQYLAAWGLTGLDWTNFGGGANAPVRVLATDNMSLIAGGDFVRIGVTRANHIARFASDEWSSFGSDPSIGINGTILSIVVGDSDVYVGGRFRTSGGVHTGGITRWNGTRWLRMGDGMNGDNAEVTALLIAPDGTLYAGGFFTRAGNTAAANIAKWDGTSWSPLGEGVTLNGGNGRVSALSLQGTRLIVGGTFNHAGPLDAAGVAFYDISTGTWSVPSGRGVYAGNVPGVVRAVGVAGELVYVGGAFTRGGSVSAQNLAIYNTTSSTWSAGYRATQWEVDAMASYTNTVWVASNRKVPIINVIGDTIGFSRNNIIDLYASGSGAFVDSSTGIVRSMSYSPTTNDLYVGGYFFVKGNTLSLSIARLRGSEWKGLGQGLVDLIYDTGSNQNSSGDSILIIGAADVRALAVDASGRGVWAGGDFQLAGLHPSSHFAHWELCGVLGVEPTSDPRAVLRTQLGNPVPNPLTLRTTIPVDLAQAGSARIEIISALGRVVAIAFDGHLPAGRSLIRFESAGLAPGVYYCRLQASGRYETVSIVVLD